MHRRFDLIRDEDETGISGKGKVAEGTAYTSGKVTLNWTLGTKLGIPSVTVFDSIEHVEAIHGHGGKTRIEWIDAPS